MNRLRIVSLGVLLCAALVHSQELKPIPLPKPETTGGKPVMQALAERKSTRDYGSEKLSPQVLSNLLWAGFGYNRPKEDKRTAPSAMNKQEIDVYVVTADGAFLYDAKANALVPVVTEDIREKTGGQPFVKDAPVNLVFVADLSKMGGPKEMRDIWTGMDAAFISENVYLFCASEGLATMVRAYFDPDALGKTLKLKPEQKAVLTQTVGYPKAK
jgi:nitroreductase